MNIPKVFLFHVLHIPDMMKLWKMEGGPTPFYLFLQKRWPVPTKINQNMSFNSRNKRGNMKMLLRDMQGDRPSGDENQQFYL